MTIVKWSTAAAAAHGDVTFEGERVALSCLSVSLDWTCWAYHGGSEFKLSRPAGAARDQRAQRSAAHGKTLTWLAWLCASIGAVLLQVLQVLLWSADYQSRTGLQQLRAATVRRSASHDT